MKMLMVLTLLLSFGCSKKSGSGGETVTLSYMAEYEYPENTLNAGEGTREVEALAIVSCRDNLGNEAETSKCLPAQSAPKKVQLSPAGLVSISVAGSIGGQVQITVAVGESLSALTQVIINIRIASNLECAVGYEKVNAECKIPGFELTFSPYTTPTMTSACMGTEFLTRIITGCVNNISLASVDPSNCSGLVDSAQSVTYASPAGTRTVTNGSNTETYTCSAGVSGGTLSDIVCGNSLEHKSGLTCVADILVPTYSYPSNTAVACDGPLIVDASAVTDCFNSSKNTSVDTSNCPMPSTKPTRAYQSPAGTKNVASGDNTNIFTCALDEVGGTQTDVVCGVVNEHKNGLICEPDVFVASDFIYPANTMTPGYGTVVASPSSFNICTNTSKSTSADVSLCSIPVGAPTETHLSPAGDADILISGAVGGKVTLTLAEGEDFFGLSQAAQDAIVAPLLTCQSAYLKSGALCKNVVVHFNEAAAGASCAFMSNGDARCFGDHTSQESGPDAEFYDEATNIPELKDAVQYISNRFGCALFGDGKVKCAGDNLNGSYGLGGAPLSDLTENPGYNGAVKLFAGAASMCGLWADGTVKCSGTNNYYQLGDGTNIHRPNPVTITAFQGAKDISMSSTGETCAVMGDNTVKCVGRNAVGQIGRGTTGAQNTAITIANWGTVKEFKLGEQRACALYANGTVRCAGANAQYNLGNGGTVASATPVTVANLSDAKSLHSTGMNTCVITNTDTVKCWGYNGGAIGNSSYTPVNGVTTITQWGTVEKLFTSNYHICALNAAKQFRCAGDYMGYGAASTVPVLIPGLQPE